MGGRLVWGVVAAGVAVIVIGIVFASRFGSDPTVSESPLIGKGVPDVEIAAYDDGGESFRLTDFGGDITVVNFWASWCTGCRREHEALTVAADVYRDLGTTFVAVNYQDTAANADAFLAEFGRSDSTVYGLDDDSRVAFEFGVLGLPETFFVDRDGVVVGKVSGPVSYELLAATIESIALGETIGEVTTGEVQNR